MLDKAMSAAAVILTEPLNAFVDDQVKSGVYPNRDAVIADALERLREERLDDDAKMARLRARLEASWEAVQRGEADEVTDVSAHVANSLARARMP